MGAGALGPVFRCHDSESDRAVAVKAFALDITPEQAIERLCDVYWALFRAHPHALRVSYKVQGKPLKSLGPAHGAFLKGVLGLLRSVAEAGRLTPGDPILAARLIATVGVPVLELYGALPDAEARFRHTLHALLLLPAEPEG